MSIESEIEGAAVAAVPGGGWLKLALKLAPFIAIAILFAAVIWQRGSLNKLHGKIDVQSQQIGDLTAANTSAQTQINGFARQRIDNDAIAAAVAKRLDNNRAQTEGQRQAIRNASNDPSVRDWANQPVPSSVRRILESPR